MGYSCSARANYTLDQVHSLDDFCLSGNLHYKYFTEIGKENRDGSITGKVYEVYHKGEYCKSIGGFRINPDGSIARFPGLSKRMFGVLEIAAIEAYDRDHAHFTLHKVAI